MAPPPQTTDGAAAPVELQPPSIEDVFPSGEIESVVPSGRVLATELTSDINLPSDKNEPSGEIEAVVSSAQISAAELTSEVKQSPGGRVLSDEMENSAQAEKSTMVDTSAEMVKSAAIVKHSQMENSSEKSNGEIDASKIKRSPENEEPSAQMEIEKSARKEKILREISEFTHRLDPRCTLSVMCFVSPLYAVLTACLLWLVADHQPQTLLWTFAHLSCLYLFLWIIALTTTKTSTVFFRITYFLMLAFTTVHLIGPVNGMIFLYTGMTYVAGMLGYALAEHLQCAGFEQTANALCSTPFNSKDWDEKVSFMLFCTVVMSLPILARTVWVFLVPYSGHMTHMDVLQVVVELTAEIFALAVLWILYITEFILRGALVSMERFVGTAFTCWIACYALAMLFTFYYNTVSVGMLVMWLEWMAIGGFFGYILAVRACYRQMLTRSDSTQAAKEQNGGT